MLRSYTKATDAQQQPPKPTQPQPFTRLVLDGDADVSHDMGEPYLRLMLILILEFRQERVRRHSADVNSGEVQYKSQVSFFAPN